MQMSRFLALSASTLFALLLGMRSAWAYLDPGTGSALLQVILGGTAAVAVALKMFWNNIAAFFTFGKRSAKKNPPEE